MAKRTKRKPDPVVNDNKQRLASDMIPIGRVASTPACDVYFMPGEVYSQKNNQQIKINGKGKNPLLIKSPQVQRWIYHSDTAYVMQWKQLATIMKQHMDVYGRPLHLGIHFVRNTRRLFDHHNMVHLILDYMQYKRCIEDDDVMNVVVHPLRLNGDYNSYGPLTPGVFIGLWKCDPMFEKDILYEHKMIRPFVSEVIRSKT